MKNYDSRLSRLETMLLPPKRKILLCVFLGESPKDSHFRVNNEEFILPPKTSDWETFILEKIKGLKVANKRNNDALQINIMVKEGITQEELPSLSKLVPNRDDYYILVDFRGVCGTFAKINEYKELFESVSK